MFLKKHSRLVSASIPVPAPREEMSDKLHMRQTFYPDKINLPNCLPGGGDELPAIVNTKTCKDVATSCTGVQNDPLMQEGHTLSRNKSVSYLIMRPTIRKSKTVSESLLPTPLHPFPIQKSGSFGGFNQREEGGTRKGSKNSKYITDLPQHESRQELLSKHFSTSPR